MDLFGVVEAFDAAASDRPLALSIRRGDEVVLHRSAGQRVDGRPFAVDTPVLLYSVVKAAVGLTATYLAARGDLDLDATVASAWPAFGRHGKQDVTIAQALSHGAAVPGWPDGMTIEGLRDVDGACALLADQPPWWPVGEPGEHAYTYGHLVSGLVRAAVGRHVHEVWSSDLAGPLGIDLNFTPHPDADPVRDPDGSFLAAIQARATAADPRLWQPIALCSADVVNAIEGARSHGVQPPIAPAVLGWGGADAIARLYAFWSGTAGHLPGKPAVWARSRRPHTVGRDHVMGDDRAWALGTSVEPNGIYGMGGIGGCVGWHDPRSGLSVGVAGPVLDSGPYRDRLDDAIDALGH